MVIIVFVSNHLTCEATHFVFNFSSSISHPEWKEGEKTQIEVISSLPELEQQKGERTEKKTVSGGDFS